MDIDWIFVKARRDCFVEITDYSDVDALIDINLIYDDLNSRIINEVDEDFYWDSSVDDTVVNQSEYPIETTWDFNIVDINKVFIKYKTTDTYYTKARRINPWALEKHPSRYLVNQPQSDPFYYVQDNSVFLYPAPNDTDWVITDWIEIFTINQPIPLVDWWAENTIKIPKRYHRIIAIWLKQYIYGSLGKLNEKNDAVNEYNAVADKMIQELKDRDQGELIEQIEDLSHLE